MCTKSEIVQSEFFGAWAGEDYQNRGKAARKIVL